MTFLYVLMRDEVTSGTVEKIMQDHAERVLPTDKPNFSNPHLEAHARELAERLQ